MQNVDIGLAQEPVRPFAELLEDAVLHQSIDLVLTGMKRLGCFLERAEHATHR
jgi:uncharacterized membrane protein